MNFMQDMTKGSPFKLLLSFSIPLLIGSLFQQFYTMADSIIVGKFVGADALASIGACSSVIYLLFSLFLGLSAGIGIVISQYFGAGDGSTVRKGIACSVYILLAASILLTLIGLTLARPILTFLGTPEEIMQDAAVYFQITSGGIVAVAFYNGISSILRALGDSRTPLIFLALAALLNVGLDLLFVTVFHMGVAGAALATAIAQFSSACACLVFSLKTNPYFHIKREEFRPDTGLIRRMMHIGLPLALQNAMIAFSCVMLQSVINSFGTMIMAVFTATNRIENLVNQIYIAANTALSNYTAQNLGAGNTDRVRAGTRCCIQITVGFSLLMVLVMYLCGHMFMGWFVTDRQVIETGAQALKLISLFFVFWGLLYVFRGILNGAGNAGFALVSGILEVVGRMGCAFLLTSIPFIGQWGIWLAEGLTWILVSAAGAICYFRGKWTQKKLIA
ncbi:MATE family efflux transporter [Faecalicatena fissicatena]|uniref:Probable multidrug resistance protein NorM n=1 Tax=Faecalicatena fissicatena TaxID=290055 RepID=A0ABS2E873_9FIRM|nr:MATE family efflux transporter [Faecalicatena fissicatena]MBM6737808.1 MATE family efflux transporter [Faecalicatena fissicatena]HIX98245.1 MATE family efflux transporter [Candidatus Dorea intestinigallinarum]